MMNNRRKKNTNHAAHMQKKVWIHTYQIMLLNGAHMTLYFQIKIVRRDKGVLNLIVVGLIICVVFT